MAGPGSTVWLLCFLCGGVGGNRTMTDYVQRLEGGQDMAYNYIAYMSIPSRTEKTCHEIYRGEWRGALVAQYASSHTANFAVCTPYGYNFRPDSCACRYCPLHEDDAVYLGSHDHEGDCVSRSWLRAHPPRVALGIGSARDARYVFEFYADTNRAATVVNIPIARDEPKWFVPSVLPFEGHVDVVVTMSELEKGNADLFCNAGDTSDVHRPGANSHRPHCAESLERIFAKLDDGLLPPLTEAQCELAVPASLKPGKGQQRFISAMSSSRRGRALLRAFHIVFYGRDDTYPDYVASLRAEIDGVRNVSYKIAGMVPLLDLHSGFCSADGIAVFPINDRNPRVVYEALQAARPLFVSLEASVAEGTACQAFVTSARASTQNELVIEGFASYARGLAKWRKDVGFIEKYVNNCISLKAALEAIWGLIFEKLGEPKVIRETLVDRPTVVCPAPAASLESCGPEYSCETQSDLALALRDCPPLKSLNGLLNVTLTPEDYLNLQATRDSFHATAERPKPEPFSTKDEAVLSQARNRASKKKSSGKNNRKK